MKHFTHALGYYLFLFVFWLGAFVLNLAVEVSAWLGRPPAPPRLRRRIHRIMGWYLGCLKFLCGLRFAYRDWPEDWREQLRGQLVIANHPSLLDAPLFLARSPQFICLYKASLNNSLFWSTTAERTGFISNVGGIDSVREAVDQLHEGATLLLFPEGTRTRETGLGPFIPGGALIASRAQCVVQTIHLDYGSPLLTKDRPSWCPPPTPLHITITWGTAFQCAPGESIQAFNRRLECYFRDHQSASVAPIA